MHRLTYNFDFESRKYDETASEAEINAIKKLVFVLEDNIIAFKEMKVISPFSTKLVFDEMDLLATQLDQYGILIDLSDSKKPDSITRRVINERFKKICEEVNHVSFCIGNNELITAAALFIMFQTNLESYSVHSTVESSIAAIKSKLNE